jgi:hypothetical protein
LKIVISLIIFFLTCPPANAQVEKRDKEWSKKIKGKLRQKIVGSLSDGFAVSYWKFSKEVFSIEKREIYKTGDQIDSTFTFAANFKNDTVFRIMIIRRIRKEEYNKAVIYLEGHQIIDQKIWGEVLLPNIPEALETANKWLLYAKSIILSESEESK